MLNIVKIYLMPLVHYFLYMYLIASVIFMSLECIYFKWN